jgi:hypothetical protein
MQSRFSTTLCWRKRNTVPQASLGRAERSRNVRHAFGVKQRIDGLSVAIVDDVATSGATLSALAEKLKKQGQNGSMRGCSAGHLSQKLDQDFDSLEQSSQPTMFTVVLFQPEIPPNTGNVIRLCANTGCELHLVKPMGFPMEDAKLRRAGLDYHEYARVVVHENWAACQQALQGRRIFAATTKGARATTRFLSNLGTFCCSVPNPAACRQKCWRNFLPHRGFVCPCVQNREA